MIEMKTINTKDQLVTEIYNSLIDSQNTGHQKWDIRDLKITIEVDFNEIFRLVINEYEQENEPWKVQEWKRYNIINIGDHNIIIDINISFSNIIFEKACSIYNVEFKKDVFFYDITYYQTLGIYRCLFQSDIVYMVWEDLFKYDFPKDCKLEFSRNEFYSCCAFKHGTLYNINLEDNVFHDEVYFWELGIICNGVFIRNSIFNKELKFLGCTMENDMCIQQTTFNHDIYIQGCKFINIIFDTVVFVPNRFVYFWEDYWWGIEEIGLWNQKLSIINTNINSTLVFKEFNCQNIDLNNSTVNQYINNLSPIKPINWETACILKNEELKRNNFVESLIYQAEEKKLLEIELNANKTWSNWADRFSLYLGKVFHNHGQNWLLALGWTILIWIGTFAVFSLPNPIYYINSELNIFCSYLGVLTSKEFWGDLVKYISPTEYELLSIYIKTSSAHGFIKFLGIVVYFIGKIFIPYGVYEVIKAFRKYK